MSPDGNTAGLGHLERIDPRSVWKHEALDFTPWLAQNADRLSEALGIDIEFTGSEHPVGGFALDLIGRDVTHDQLLIVENQLATSDHSHLGQLLTYAAGTDAATIVWLAPRLRDEHRQALTWLNERTDQETHFFGVELEVVRIGDSAPAPLFNVVVLPNDWQKSVKAAAAAVGGGKSMLYNAFWAQFLERLTVEHPGWSRVKQPPNSSWFSMSSGAPSGSQIVSAFAANGRLRHELYIGRSTKEECFALFDSLHDQRAVFEAAYGRTLEWDRLESNKACRIAEYRAGTIENESDHGEYSNWFIDAGVRMRTALTKVEFD